jgi:LysM repeat protein
MSAKTAAGLVAYAKAQLGKPYWYGTYGNKPTEAKLIEKSRQYPYPKYSSYSPARMERFRSQIGQYDRVHDCVGLIKGYLWSDTPSSPPKYSAAQDVSASGIRAKCKALEPIATLPDVQGLLVFIGTAHVGVYIGAGQVIEARGSDFGVVQTALKSRGWTHWGKLTWLDYGAEKPSVSSDSTITHTIKKGDTLWALASRYLGNGQRWPEIQALNSGVDPKKLRIGMTIKIKKEGKKS